jgi:hypothetical protein
LIPDSGRDDATTAVSSVYRFPAPFLCAWVIVDVSACATSPLVSGGFPLPLPPPTTTVVILQLPPAINGAGVGVEINWVRFLDQRAPVRPPKSEFGPRRPLSYPTHAFGL